MTRRAPGQGTIETLPSGRFRVKLPTATGRRQPLGPFDTWEQADSARKGALAALAKDKLAGGVGIALYGYGLRRLEEWESQGKRNAVEDKRVWKRYVQPEPFASWPIENISRRDARRFRDSMLARVTKKGAVLARSTVTIAVGLCRRVFGDAVEDELVSVNPFVDLKIPKRPRTHEPWTYLTPAEQAALIKAAGTEGLVAAFAIGTGLRETEQWMLELVDVHVDGPHPHVVVRYGKRTGVQGRSAKTSSVTKHPPKNGKIRKVPLFGVALDAARAWLEIVPRAPEKNWWGLMFPGERGGYRADKKAPKGFKPWLKKAGIGRTVRWHDLRHTCASSLVAGWWGRPWRLEEVCAHLGHSSITVTQRYAHLAPSALDMAAAETHRAHSESSRSPRSDDSEGEMSGGRMQNNEFVNRRSRVQISKAAPRKKAESSAPIRRRGPRVDSARSGGVRGAVKRAVEAAQSGSIDAETSTHALMRDALRMLGLRQPRRGQ